MLHSLERLGELIFPELAHSVLAQELGPTSFQLVSRDVLRPIVLAGLREEESEPAFKAAFDALVGETMNRVIAARLEVLMVSDPGVKAMRALFEGLAAALERELSERIVFPSDSLKTKFLAALSPKLESRTLRFRLLATFDASSLTNRPNLPEAVWRKARRELQRAVR